jgi:hypothetical protein
MKKSQSIVWFVIAVVFAVLATVLILSYMVTDPGHVILELGADCGKNYFTFLYHSVYGKGVWFEGMNYPYGEHIIYADGQPMLSCFLHLFRGLSVDGALKVMNLCIGLSYVLAIVYTYLILLRFSVQPFIAILFACLINLFAPQVLRIQAHFALAYLCPVPMLFYWTLRYHYTSKWKWPLYILVMGFIMAFMHLYIGAIIFFWIAFYATGYVLLIRSPLRERLQHVAPMLVVAITLFLLIKGGIALTDPIKDRPSFPLNTLEYVTHIKDIVSSPFSYFWQYIRYKTNFNRLSDAGEGYSYLGLVAIFFIFVSAARGFLKKIRKRPGEEFLVSEQGFSPVWIFVATGSLLLAMGAPFIWHMHWLLNYLSLFKQFRAMGRFVWTFYYIATIYAAVAIHFIYQQYLKTNKRVMAYALMAAAIGLWGLDVSRYIKNIRAHIANGLSTYDEFVYKNEPVKWPEYLAEHHYKGSDFQGIILLPLFFSGSEKIWVGGDPSWPLKVGMRIALQFHLPIVDVMMSRTSWSITEKQVKTAAGPYADKPMLRDLKSNKPFLLIQYDGIGIDTDQQYLFKASEYLGHRFNGYIYACYPDRMIANDRKNADTINAIIPYMHTMDSCIADKGAWYADHFDTKKADEQLFGAGAAPLVDKDSVTVASIPVKPAGDSQKYEFSCWFLLGDKDYKSPYVNLQSIDSTGKVISTVDALTKLSVDNKGMWFRASVYFYLKPQCRRLKCIVVSEQPGSYRAMDELLLRPADAVIISKAKDGGVIVNNHLFAGAGIR